MHDDYKQLDLSEWVTAPPNGRVLEPCPLCASEAQLWQYSESETSPRQLVVMCSHGDRIGPQDGLTNEGCPFYMPRDGHYRETIRDAVRYWNELANAIVALRQSNAGAPWCHEASHGRQRCEQQCATCAAEDADGGAAGVAPATPTEATEAEQVCYEAYAAIGTLLFDMAERGHQQAEKLMDNLSEARLVHTDVLPFDDAAGAASATPADAMVALESLHKIACERMAVAHMGEFDVIAAALGVSGSDTCKS